MEDESQGVCARVHCCLRVFQVRDPANLDPCHEIPVFPISFQLLRDVWKATFLAELRTLAFGCGQERLAALRPEILLSSATHRSGMLCSPPRSNARYPCPYRYHSRPPPPDLSESNPRPKGSLRVHFEGSQIPVVYANQIATRIHGPLEFTSSWASQSTSRPNGMTLW